MCESPQQRLSQENSLRLALWRRCSFCQITLTSCLSGRLARIKVNSLTGEWIDSDHGTSAGTILGAILFLTYVHDTPACIQYKFADDLATIAADNDICRVECTLQESLYKMEKWSEKWYMTLNAEKTKVMLSGNSDAKLSMSLLGKPIEQVSKMKYLGVWINEHSNFDNRAEYAASKATGAFAKIDRLISKRKGLSLRTGIMLCKSLVRPHMEYSVATWACMSEKSTKLLEKVQGCYLRSILQQMHLKLLPT